MYQVHRVNIGKTPQLDELAHACGELYSRTLVSYWRTVRHKGVWLGPGHLMRWHTSPSFKATIPEQTQGETAKQDRREEERVTSAQETHAIQTEAMQEDQEPDQGY